MASVDIIDFYNSKDDAPYFQTEDEAREWAESLGMGKYGICFCYINGRFTMIADCGQSEDGYRGDVEMAMENFLSACGFKGYEVEGTAIDLGAEMCSVMFDCLERWNIMDAIWLYDTF
jgi:hypothetical protein